MVCRLACAFAVAAGSAIVSAQGPGPLLPSYPKLAFGASVTPAYDGWYDNADGTHTFLIGYYSRNWEAPVDVPIGPNNHFEPGEPDRGQPTHFLPNRNFGMFTITVPKNTAPTERLWWVLTANGITQRVPFHMSPDYNITPTQASEESPGGRYNKPAMLKFAEKDPWTQSPVANTATALKRTAIVNQPLTLDMWVADDALYTSGTNAPLLKTPTLVELVVNKYRGPGQVTVGKGHEKIATTKGGKLEELYEGKASTTLTFSEPGDYIVHVTANDMSGPGGGAAGCCWTTAMVKVDVKPAGGARVTGQQ
ncbi:MAG: hypothetical protein AB7Q29_13255 [Vicinamibacterales bacterium]